MPVNQPSEKQSAASRANGAKSKGPATPEGRARASRNSLRHGLSSEIVVLPHEDRAHFEQLRDSYRGKLRARRPAASRPGRNHGRRSLASEPPATHRDQIV
jgi:hypothetical protein